MNIDVKKCSKCKLEKPISEFSMGIRYICKSCDRIRAADWRSRNPEKYRAAGKRWYQNNKEIAKRYQKKWKKENLPYVLIEAKKWRLANPEKHRQSVRNWNARNRPVERARVRERQASKLKATPKWSIKFFVQEAYHLAELRNKATGFEWHVDHIVPIKSDIVCGLHAHTNIQVIPAKQNMSKGNYRWARHAVKLFTDEYISLNARLHVKSRRFGYNAAKRKSIVKELVERYAAASVLDYGSGKGSLKEVMGEIVRNYDPAIPEFSSLPEPADLVVCLDVMEHIEPPFVDNVLDHIKALTLKAAYFIIVFHESKDILPDGRNAHVCIEDERFWDGKLTERFKIVDRFISERREGFYEVVPWKS